MDLLPHPGGCASFLVISPRQWGPSKSNPGTGESQSQRIKTLEYLREARPRREITQAIGSHSNGKQILFHPCGVLKIFVSILKFGKSHINPQISSFFLRKSETLTYGHGNNQLEPSSGSPRGHMSHCPQEYSVFPMLQRLFNVTLALIIF